MPELPEVETTRTALASALTGKTIEKCLVRRPNLRYLIPPGFAQAMTGNRFVAWQRRGKYLIVVLKRGRMLIHLGMSGSLTYGPPARPGKHDHIIWQLKPDIHLRYCDPRRFGYVDFRLAGEFKPLEKLGVEPLERGLNGKKLLQLCHPSRQAIKVRLLDQRFVAGLGNIYVSEALFLSGIHPQQPACSIDLDHCTKLSRAIKQVLRRSLRAGGTSLKDYSYGQEWSGYFALSLKVYERDGQACFDCGTTIQRQVLGGRSTYHCPRCQPRTPI